MKNFIVRTPVKADSKRLGVQIINGEGKFTDEKLVPIFKSWGYEVEEVKEKKEAPKKQAPKKQANKK